MTGRVTAIAAMILCLIQVCATSVAQSSHSVNEEAGITGQIEVPFDHQHPNSGSFSLEYELGRPFDKNKPTVIVVADGQQFYVRHGMIAPLQKEVFGDDFNVVGVIGRGFNPAVKARVVLHDNQVDWRSAYDLYRWEQWADDIEAVREKLVGPAGQVCLYGRSGGGLLVDQYLARYPQYVVRAFTQAAVNPYVNAEYRLNPDHFWDQLGSLDPVLQTHLLDALDRHPEERATIVLLLQRQNFFVPAEHLAVSRRQLVDAIYSWNRATIARYEADYQVDVILKMITGSDNPAGNVRLFEFLYPLLDLYGQEFASSGARVDPDYEVQRISAQPLLQLLKEGHIPAPAMSVGALHKTDADVFLLAGYFDHIADYRSQIAVAASFGHHHLLLLRDDHDFLALQKTGIYPRLVHDALIYGSNSQEMGMDEEKVASLRYSEF